MINPPLFSQIKKITAARPFAYSIFLILVLSPFFFQKWKLKPVPLFAVSGDEPHFLVMAASIAKDHDLAVGNNYKNRDYGQNLKQYNLDHHTYLKKNDGSMIVPWNEVYIPSEENSRNFILSEKYSEINTDEFYEIPLHPPGYSMLLAALFYPLFAEDIFFTESIVIFFQLLFFYFAVISALKSFAVDSPFRFFLLALSLPVWVLNCGFYTEGLLGSLLILSFCHLNQKSVLLFSLDLSLLIFIKEIYIPVALILYLLFILENSSAKRNLAAGILPAAGVFFYFLKNYYIFGDPFQTYVPFTFNPHLLNTLYDIFFSSHKGIFIFTPHLIFLPAVFWKLYKSNPPRGILISLLTFVFFTITVLHQNWSGGPSFSYRTLAPVLSFTFPLFLNTIKNPALKILILIFSLISFMNMFYAATNLGSSYASPPFINLLEFEKSRLAERI